MRARPLIGAISVSAALALGAPSAHAARGISPNGMRGLGGATQVIEIASRGMRTTPATARTYRRVDERWRLVHRAMPARLGRAGLSHARRRIAGDGTTPIGDYGFNAGLAYRYAAVIDFNYIHPVYGRGSGIFLHVDTGGPTEGCVSLPEPDLLGVLRWMRPGARILIGPTRWLRSRKMP